MLGERDVPVVFMTLTNNSRRAAGLDGEPARGVEAQRRRRRAALPGCVRFAENAWFVKLREEAMPDTPVPEIVRETASLAGRDDDVRQEGPTGNIGGWLALDDDEFAEQCRNLLILTEGFDVRRHGWP